MGKPFCPEGGRFMLDAWSWVRRHEAKCFNQTSHLFSQFLYESEAHKPKSYFDVAPKLYEANPPPGTYDAKGTFVCLFCRVGNSGFAKPSPGSVEFKAVGQVVYRYESATSSESKEMVAQAHPEKVLKTWHVSKNGSSWSRLSARQLGRQMRCQVCSSDKKILRIEGSKGFPTVGENMVVWQWFGSSFHDFFPGKFCAVCIFIANDWLCDYGNIRMFMAHQKNRHKHHFGDVTHKENYFHTTNQWFLEL